MGASSAALTTPCTVRAWSSFFLLLCAKPRQAQRIAMPKRESHGRRKKLMPLLLSFLFFLFVHFLCRFQFQRIRTQHLQNGAALVATDGIALVDFFLVRVDHA